LQRAALATLAHPDADRNSGDRDEEWLANPTGAIVLLSTDGDVLAAASYPNIDRGEAPRAARDTAFERTLRQPTFQPPGSVFKPFVAVWALDHVAGFNPTAPRRCEFVPALKFPGYIDVRCNTVNGHGSRVDLRDALMRSCNSYFAWLGEQLVLDDWRGLAHEFGFGEPTGIRSQGARRGLREDTVPTLFDTVREGRDQRVAACGLSIVQATPMQVARATAALATGTLSDLRIVRAVAGTEIEHHARPLSLSRESLDFVREAMGACANEGGGSAQPALNSGEIGFRVCAKTGSGDISTATTTDANGKTHVRKHAWLTCYFPPEKPQFVLVVFVHDTTQTASHSAIWIGRQFLLQPAVKSYLAEKLPKR
jgi:penicillin-binding protein 2